MSIFNIVKNFYDNFKGEKLVIGNSVKNKPIYAFSVVKTKKPVILIQGAIHAREFVTAKLCLDLAKDFNDNGEKGTVWFVPMVNPDGVEIALKENPLYKANANGVDLNVNFPAKWGKGKSNVFTAGSENFVGKFPLSEPESKALYDFTLKIKPDMSISYHTKGEEIYWEFFQDKKRRIRDERLAKIVSYYTGYPLISIKGSAGGYKDWCIKELKIPALTIEVGEDNLMHPIGLNHSKSIFRKNKKVLSALICGLENI